MRQEGESQRRCDYRSRSQSHARPQAKEGEELPEAEWARTQVLP